MIVDTANRLHDVNYADGDLLTALVLGFCIIHIKLGIQYVEELLVGGLGVFNLKSVPSNYFSHFTAFIALYYSVSVHLGFPIQLILPKDQECQKKIWARFTDERCKIKI